MQYDQDMIREAMRLAKSPAGQQLIQLLQASNASQLQKAMDSAASGDYQTAKQSLSALLSTPEAQALLSRMGGADGPNGR